MRVRRVLSLPKQENVLLTKGKPRCASPHTCEREAWPAQGIRHDSSIDDYTWGYLRIDDNGSATFDESEKPSREEILLRWGHYLSEASIE